MKYKKGSRVKIHPKNDNENYREFRGKVLIVTHAANKYMSAEEFFKRGRPDGYHPGYDEGVYPEGLYDLKVEKTGEDVPFSLYDWELI